MLRLYRLIVLSVLIIINACSGADTDMAESETTQRQAVGINVVDTYILTNQSFVKQLWSNGRLVALKKTDLYFRHSLPVHFIKVRNGEHIIADQIIAVLDTAEWYNNWLQTRTALQQAQIEQEKQLIEFGLQNTPDSAQHTRNAIAIRSGYTQAVNALQAARIQLDYCTLRAPFSGLLANIQLKEHDRTSLAEPFCTLIDNSRFEVSFQILETEVSQISVGQTLIVRPLGITHHYTGTVSEINPIVNEHGMLTAKAIVANVDGQLIEGMNVSILAETPIPSSFAVPKQAVVRRSDQEVVFTLVNGYAKWKYVKTLDENEKFYQISNELQPGDTVIVSGNLNLAHDSRVVARLNTLN